MLSAMTIAARRRVYWCLFLVACLCLTAFIPLFASLLRRDAEPSFLAASNAFGRFKLLGIDLPSPRLIGAGIGLGALYAVAALGLILRSFRKTVSTEVFFYSFWVLSVACEILRLAVFDLAAAGGAPRWQALTTRALFFTRYAGQLSLLAASLYAAGFRNEKLGTIAALVFCIAAGIAVAMPVNTQSYAFSLELRAGYADLHFLLFLVVSCLTVADFYHAARTTGEKSFRLAALGSAAFMAGRQILVSQWNPLAIVAGFALLATGSWLFVSRLHAYYLWQ
jgi:hypothetical protein